MEKYLPVITLGTDVAYGNFLERGRKMMDLLIHNSKGLNKEDLAVAIGYSPKSANSSAKNFFLSCIIREVIEYVDDKVVLTHDKGIPIANHLVPEECTCAFNSGIKQIPIEDIIVFLAVYSDYSTKKTITVATKKESISSALYRLGVKEYVTSDGSGQYYVSDAGKKLGDKIAKPILTVEDILRGEERRRYQPLMTKRIIRLAHQQKDPAAIALLGEN